MFHSTRIKLTAWYLLIIMAISIAFSAAIFRILSSELNRLEQVERLRIERRLPGINFVPPGATRPVFFDPDVLTETKNRLLLMLVCINTMIAVGSAVAGYFLAGRTLKPIADMMEEQNRFITDASHELRTPLTSLKSEIEVNLRDPELSVSQAKALLQSNLEDVNSLQTLSDGLIKLTQYQKGNNGLPITAVSFPTVVKEAIRKVTAAANRKNITIMHDVKNVRIEGNQQSLTELVVILLDNAVKYSPKQTTVQISAVKTDGKISLKIVDQGIGIDEQDIPHLFDRFFRADKSRTKTGVQGYGLGLAIAKQIVDSHNGSIRVTSIRNKGTSFTIELPVKHG